jgi:hypothetical protein
MPQRPPSKLVSLVGKDLDANIRTAWKEGKFRPTVVLIGIMPVSDRVYAVPLVNYENAPGGQLMLPQRIITKGETIHRAAWALLSDAFTLELPPQFSHPKVKCYGYYDHKMPVDRRPEGFSSGKRYYFAEVDLDSVGIKPKRPELQKDPNPVRTLTALTGLHSIRAALANLPSEDKRWASVDSITEALQRRYERDTKEAARTKRKIAA